MGEPMSPGDVIRRRLIGSGDCGSIVWSFPGLSVPAWSLLWFVLLALLCVVAAVMRRRRGGR